MIRTRLGELDCLVSEERAVTKPEKLVVLCHGFGAPGEDLAPLASELCQLRPDLGHARFVFPAAPLELDGFGFGDSRAWWMIDPSRFAGLERNPEALKALRREIPEGLGKARRQLMAAVEQLLKQTGLEPGQLVLGGFSQGAMLATDVALRLEEAPAGLVVLSGTLLCEDDWTRRAEGRKGLPVFQSHGMEDPLLPFAAAEALRDLFIHAGLPVEFLPFRGGHGIPYEVLERLAAFMQGRLKP